MAAKYLQMIRTDPEEGWEDELNRWYDEDHIPSLLGVPGFLWAKRYVGIEGSPKYMALYEIESPEAIKTEAYVKARDSEWTLRIRSHRRNHTRNVYELIYPEVGRDRPAGDNREHTLLVVRMEPEEDWEDEFNRWYNEDHVPALLGVPGFISGRRYVAIEGGPKYMAMYEVESPAVFQTDVYKRDRETAWTLRIRPHRRNHTRNVYQVLHRR